MLRPVSCLDYWRFITTSLAARRMKVLVKLRPDHKKPDLTCGYGPQLLRKVYQGPYISFGRQRCYMHMSIYIYMYIDIDTSLSPSVYMHMEPNSGSVM